jgi:hypothetical protein
MGRTPSPPPTRTTRLGKEDHELLHRDDEPRLTVEQTVEPGWWMATAAGGSSSTALLHLRHYTATAMLDAGDEPFATPQLVGSTS